MLKEYVNSGDVPEVERQLRALNAPFLHHDVVKQAILIATDDMPHCKVCLLPLTIPCNMCIPPRNQLQCASVFFPSRRRLRAPAPVDCCSLHEAASPLLSAIHTGDRCTTARCMRVHVQHCRSAPNCTQPCTCSGSQSLIPTLDFSQSVHLQSGPRQPGQKAIYQSSLCYPGMSQLCECPTPQSCDIQEPMLKLLDVLSHTVELSSLQIYKGFQRFLDQLDDLALDTPHLHDSFHTFYTECISRGVIDPADQSVLEDTESRKRSCDGEMGDVNHAAAHVRTVAAFQADSLKTIREYFDSSDATEVARILTVCPSAPAVHLFVASFARNNRPIFFTPWALMPPARVPRCSHCLHPCSHRFGRAAPVTQTRDGHRCNCVPPSTRALHQPAPHHLTSTRARQQSRCSVPTNRFCRRCKQTPRTGPE
jgi:hypothetical protein